ncbi:hemagglutination activity domain protein [Burkholderia thailandensis USAMRU Malaysia |nr:hemagglutination activity domain protein [Burkholderia thailandensis 2002721723]AHI82487.1 hemagglutination activity domain protein [Burkholderia thailandensis E444]AIC89890.1 hemagglutination activity domain protein [Burkholderia thailandensis USAMRU Malaysia \
MNNKTYRLVYSRLRGMVVAVEETAAAAGKSAGGETRAGRRSRTVRAASVAMAVSGILPVPALAQIVPTPGAGTQVIQTQNGLPQVNVARPSSAGVSVNTYNQFDVQKAGAILNNSASMVQTQQGAGSTATRITEPDRPRGSSSTRSTARTHPKYAAPSR